jgi:hypothetical protein
MREVPAAAHPLEASPREAGERAAVARRRDRVAVAVDDEHRAAQPLRELPQRGALADVPAEDRRRERVGVGLERPPHPVLDALRRMGLGEAARDEPLGEARVVLAPVERVHAAPPHRGHPPHEQRRRAGVQQRRPVRGGVREHRPDERRSGDALGRQAREREQELGAFGQRHHHGALGGGGVHHREEVARELLGGVALRIAHAVGAAVAESVHREHAEVAGEVGDLHLPVARVH